MTDIVGLIIKAETEGLDSLDEAIDYGDRRRHDPRQLPVGVRTHRAPAGIGRHRAPHRLGQLPEQLRGVVNGGPCLD